MQVSGRNNVMAIESKQKGRKSAVPMGTQTVKVADRQRIESPGMRKVIGRAHIKGCSSLLHN